MPKRTTEFQTLVDLVKEHSAAGSTVVDRGTFVRRAECLRRQGEAPPGREDQIRRPDRAMNIGPISGCARDKSFRRVRERDMSKPGKSGSREGDRSKAREVRGRILATRPDPQITKDPKCGRAQSFQGPGGALALVTKLLPEAVKV
jgi:hypothetical protein